MEVDYFMAYEICKRCGKMFDKNGKTYCKDCFEKNEREYSLIYDHIRQNPNATVLDIITGTGVSLKTIDLLVEEGGISYVENKLSLNDKEEDINRNNKVMPKISKFHLSR